MLRKIVFSQHALEQMKERGASKEDIEIAIGGGEKSEAKKGRKSFRYNFQYNKKWADKYFAIKQVMPIVLEHSQEYIVITVYVFYF